MNFGLYLLMLIAFLFGLYAQVTLKTTYSTYSRMASSRNFTGQSAARFILDNNGLQDVKIEPIRGSLTDHYDPRAKVVRLSEGVFGNHSIAAVGIAAHECGHAIQHHVGYFPLRIRNTIIPITNFGSKLAMPLILIGIFFTLPKIVTIGIFAYSLMALFQLITLPVEFNASRRALKIIDQTSMLQGQEYHGAKKTLKAAAMTYVAALLSAITQLFVLISMVSGRNRRKR